MLSLKGSFRRKRASQSTDSDPQEASVRSLVSSIRNVVRRRRTSFNVDEPPRRVMRMMSNRVVVPTGIDDKELARMVMRITSPEMTAVSGDQLALVADAAVNCRASALDAAIRALGYRLDGANEQSIINSLAIADHLLYGINAPRAAVAELRDAIEKGILPKVMRIAKGLPSAPGDNPPPPAACSAALNRLQEWEWASTNYSAGALVQDPAFADAYREAALHSVTHAVSCDA